MHNHDCHCFHDLRYCSVCDTVYCKKCDKEWERKYQCWTYASTGTGIGTGINSSSTTLNSEIPATPTHTHEGSQTTVGSIPDAIG